MNITRDMAAIVILSILLVVFVITVVVGGSAAAGFFGAAVAASVMMTYSVCATSSSGDYPLIGWSMAAQEWYLAWLLITANWVWHLLWLFFIQPKADS